MIKIERLSSHNWDQFVKLHKIMESKHIYDKNFIAYYNKQNFFTKSLSKKFVKLFKSDDEYIGYIWHEPPFDTNIKIWSLFIKYDYIDKINSKLLSQFDNSILSYDAIDSQQTNDILNKLGFTECITTYLMELNSENLNFSSIQDCKLKINHELIKKYNIKSDECEIKFRKYIDGKDEEIRCNIQNQIFESKNRVPLTYHDIYSDTMQSYYIKNMSLFIQLDDKEIGFGQIIYSRSMHTIVNFGIIPDFRGYGLSKILLRELLILCNNNHITTVNLRVASNNKIAINLYLSQGFKEKYKISSWDRANYLFTE